MLIDGIVVEKIEDVRKFKDLIWSNSFSEVVLKFEEIGRGIRVYDLCFLVCNRWLTDDLFDFMF